MATEVISNMPNVQEEIERHQYTSPVRLEMNDQFEDEVAQKISAVIATQQQTNSFYLVNLQAIRERVALWDQLLPRVNLFYAMKCNPNQKVLQTLIRMGKNFECASFAEIQKVINLGGNPDKIIYAQPMKDSVQLRKAGQQGINFTVFDSVEELLKIKKVIPNAQLLLRIGVVENEARCPMTKKFGALPQFWSELLEKVKELQLILRGVSFHVGSGGCKAEIFEQAIIMTQKVFDMAQDRELPPLDIIDIGGGFTMDGKPGQNFVDVAPMIQGFLDKYFPSENNITFMGEPGRLITQNSMTTAVRIIGVKDFKEGGRQYYINGSIYQGFASQIYDFEFQDPEPLLTKAEIAKRKINSSVI